MRTFTLLCAFATIAAVQADSSRIIGGEAAKIGQFPWQVLIRFQRPEGRYYCGGTLISNRWVITAAHCTKGSFNYTLKFGGIARNEYEPGSIQVNSSRVIMHPKYDGNLKNDIALIRTSTAIKFNYRIKPAKLPKKGNMFPANKKVTVSGWGQTKNVGPGSDSLNYVAMTTITNKKCKTHYKPIYILESTLCAIGNPLNNTCNGDSGGPVVTLNGKEATHVAIVSFGDARACTAGPAGFVRVESYLDFIHENTGIK